MAASRCVRSHALVSSTPPMSQKRVRISILKSPPVRTILGNTCRLILAERQGLVQGGPAKGRTREREKPRDDVPSRGAWFRLVRREVLAIAQVDDIRKPRSARGQIRWIQ